MSVSEDKNPSTLIPDSVTLIDFTHIDSVTARLVLGWRNHEDVRKWMLHSSIISEAEHRTFINRLKEDSTKQYFVIQIHKQPIGVIDFYQMEPGTNSCYYGYFLKPESIGSSLGILLEFIAAEYALIQMGLKHLIAETLPSNTRAMRLHRQFGFQDGTINASGLQESSLSSDQWFTHRQHFASLVERLTS